MPHFQNEHIHRLVLTSSHRFLTKILELVFQIYTFLNSYAYVKQPQFLQNLTYITSKINGANKCN
jgi:hypothetical protein